MLAAADAESFITTESFQNVADTLGQMMREFYAVGQVRWLMLWRRRCPRPPTT